MSHACVPRDRPQILLLNPNTSSATTAMMLAVAREACPDGLEIDARTVTDGVPMIVNETELAAAEAATMAFWSTNGAGWSALIIGAFGDPALQQLRRTAGVPVAGLCEAAMLEAAAHGRRFGVATVTPQLRAVIAGTAARLQLAERFTGTELTEGPPLALAADAKGLERQLLGAARRCIDAGAESVIIGGGPLSLAAGALRRQLEVPVVSPVQAAVRQVAAALHGG